MEQLDSNALSAILRDLPVGVWVARAPGGEFLYANEAFRQIMRTAPKPEAHAGHYTEPYGIYGLDGKLFPEDQLPFVQAVQQRRTVQVDGIVIHRGDGTRVNVRAFGKPLFGASGEIDLVLVTFYDVTAEVQAQARLDLALEHAPIIVWAVDANGIITLSQGKGVAALGFRPGEIEGKSVYELYGQNPGVLSNMRRALSGESFHVYTEVGGAVLEGWMGPLRDPAGRVTGVIGITTDVTERHRAQKAMFRSERMAAMGTMAASVAHEINNPLTYVLEGLRSIEKELGPTAGPRVKQLLSDVKEGAERVRVITSDLQTFSRRDDEPLAPVDVSCATRTALQMLSSQLEGRARVALDLSDGVHVLASERRLVQVLMNLLLNAIHAVREVERPGGHEIRVVTRLDGGDAVVEVADTGKGVPLELMERIFEPFVTTKAVGEGTGLGLFVCRNLIGELRGRIDVDNRAEGGAVFRVRIPAAEPAKRHEGARVLVIDDNVNLGRVMASALDLQRYQTKVVHSGREAVDVLTSGETFDLVFCDLMMKDVSGMDVYDELKKRRPGAEAALVFMTGGAFTERARKFLDSVPNVRLQKPFDICDQVARLLQRRES